MNATVIEKIKTVLKSSPFGSGELAADFLPWSTEEELKSAEDGLYVVEADDVVGERYFSPESREYQILNRGISWRSEIRVPYEIENDTLRVLLGCGVHSAEYCFDLLSGDLIDVSPDDEPSSCFYRDGDNINSDRRKAYLMKFAN